MTVKGAKGPDIREILAGGGAGNNFVGPTLIVAANNSVDPTRADTLYRCDGVADDVEINAALVAAAGGRVLLLEGTYNCVANIVVPANTTLEGQGFGSILNFNDGGAGTVTSAGAITVNGDHVILKYFKAQLAAGCGAAGTRPNLVTIDTHDYDVVDHLWLVGDTSVADDGSNLRQNGVCVDTGTGILVSKCYIESDDRHAIYFGASALSSVEGNVCYSCSDEGIYFYDVDYSNISNNIVSGCSHGMYVNLVNDIAIVGNVCHDNVTSGIKAATRRITIVGNTCYSNAQRGIELSNAEYITMVGNYIHDNGIGMELSGYYLVVAGNIVEDNTSHGIQLSYVRDVVVVGNNVLNQTSGGSHGIYILQISAGNPVTVTGNVCRGNDTHGIYCYRSSYCVISANVCTDQENGDGINVTGDGTQNADHNNITGNECYNNPSHGIEIAGGANANHNKVKDNKLNSNGTEFADAGTDTEMATIVVPFVDGTDPQDSGYLIDANTEYARTYLRLPPEVQQVVKMEVYARSVVLEADKMRLEMVVYGGADNEPYTTHNGSVANLASISANFAADDVIFWRNTEAGTLALLGGDSVEVKVLHEAAGNGDCATNAYFRTAEIHYV